MTRILAIMLVVILCLLFLASIQLHVSAVDSCVRYWKFDEESVIVAHNSCGTGNDGAIIAIATVLKLIGVF